jgi:hypothetical protein
VLLTGLACIAIGAGSASALPPFTTATKSSTASPSTPQSTLVSITVRRHPGFDRTVFRFRGSTPGFRVRYVPRVVQDASGLPVPLLGTRFIQATFVPTVNGTTANAPRTITPRFPTLRQIKVAGDFEGVANYGFGLSHRVGFRVFTLTSPRRIVIDVAR